MPTRDFKGKQHTYAHLVPVPYRLLRPDEDRSLNLAGADDNLIIGGQSPGLKTLMLQLDPRSATK